MDLQLAGKRALVTGSSSGIGTGIAQAIASQGARIVVTGRNAGRAEAVAQSIRDEGGEAVSVAGDLSTDAEAAVVAERSEEHTSELQSLMRISYAVFCLKKTTHTHTILPISTSNCSMI